MAAFLHVVPDDKFIDDAIVFFSDLGGSHRWLSITNETVAAFSYIKSDNVESVFIADLECLLKEGFYDVVVFHTLYSPFYQLVLQVPDGKIVIWNSWGADIYYGSGCYSPLVKLDLFKKLTRKNLVEENVPLEKRVKRAIKDIIIPSRFRNRRNYERRVREETEKCAALQQKAISRIDFCSTVLKPEYDELEKLSYFKAIYYPFKYVSKKLYTNNQLHFDGECILVGNSADPSNNHLDVLHVLDKRNIINKRIVPLSYGMIETVSILKEKYGRDDKVELLTEFLDRSKYWEKLMACKAAVFGHIRQQAMANINQCLLQGSKVFLYKDSVVYKYYRDEGISVFSIEDDLFQHSIDRQLPEEVVEHNRKKILDLWGYDNVMRQVKDSLSFLVGSIDTVSAF